MNNKHLYFINVIIILFTQACCVMFCLENDGDMLPCKRTARRIVIGKTWQVGLSGKYSCLSSKWLVVRSLIFVNGAIHRPAFYPYMKLQNNEGLVSLDTRVEYPWVTKKIVIGNFIKKEIIKITLNKKDHSVS